MLLARGAKAVSRSPSMDMLRIARRVRHAGEHGWLVYLHPVGPHPRYRLWYRFGTPHSGTVSVLAFGRLQYRFGTGVQYRFGTGSF